MRAIILVGGFGTRLRPLTAHTPKQMLPVVDRPMIERVVTSLARFGVTDAVLSLGYRPDAFLEAYPDDTCAGVALHYAVEPEPLDTAGAVRFAADDGGIEHTFLVVNGDVLTDLDVSTLWDFHQRQGAEGTIALTPVDDPSRYGVVPIHGDGRVEAFVEKPPPGQAPTNWINAGTYVLEPSVLERIPAGRRVSIERATFPEMVADGSLYAMHSDSYWIDAGTPATYLQSQLDLIDGHRGEPEAAVSASAVDRRRRGGRPRSGHGGVPGRRRRRHPRRGPAPRCPRGTGSGGGAIHRGRPGHRRGRGPAGRAVRDRRRRRRGRGYRARRLAGARRGRDVKALVTGGAGFIGSTLVDRLLAEGHAVDVLDNLSSGSLANLASARSDRSYEFSFHQIDVRDPSVIELIERRHPDVVFHLAAQADVRVSVSRPVFDAEINIIGGLHVLEGAAPGGRLQGGVRLERGNHLRRRRSCRSAGGREPAATAAVALRRGQEGDG